MNEQKLSKRSAESTKMTLKRTYSIVCMSFRHYSHISILFAVIACLLVLFYFSQVLLVGFLAISNSFSQFLLVYWLLSHIFRPFSYLSQILGRFRKFLSNFPRLLVLFAHFQVFFLLFAVHFWLFAYFQVLFLLFSQSFLGLPQMSRSLSQVYRQFCSFRTYIGCFSMFLDNFCSAFCTFFCSFSQLFAAFRNLV